MPRTISIRPRTAAAALTAVAMTLAIVGGHAAEPHLTVDRVAAFPNLAGTLPTGLAWSPDSTKIAFLWNDKGYPFRDVWVADRDGKPRRVTDVAAAFPDAEPAGLEKDAALAFRVAARQRGGVDDVAWLDGKTLVFAYQGRLLQAAADGSGQNQIGARGGSRTAIAVSPDGLVLSFVQDGDLWFRYLKTGEQVAITHFARPSIAIGAAPGGTFSGLDARVASYRWSPDSRSVAIYFEDRTRLRKILIPNYLGAETHVVTERRDFPGDNDADRFLSIYSVADGGVRRLALPDSSDRRIGGYEWSPDSKLLLVDQSSENVVHRWLTLANAADAGLRELYHDQRDTRTSAHWNSKWQSDGKGVLLISDLDGRHAIYSLPLAGGTPKRLTDPAWSVIGESGPSPLVVSAASHEVFFLSTKKNEEERQIYRMPEGGGAVTQVTTLAGVHAPYLAPDGRTLASIRSEDVTPPELYTMDAAGSPERRITQSPTDEFAQYHWIRPRYVTFKSRTDGVILHGRLWEPPNLDRTKKYAAILGPVYSNSVRNRWGDREEWRGLYNTFQQYLVMEGQYVSLQIDVRGSVGHGQAFREKLQRDFGGIDVEDVHSGAEFLATLGYVDMNRLGIWGSSYGGLMTSMSLFKKPGVYKAGVASAPATSLWHATTGEVRVARRPDSDPDAYRKMSVISYGENLQDHLMILHGMEDDIVLFKDSVTLAEKLMLLGKKFDFVVSPTSVHPWSTKDYVATYMLNKIVDHFDRYLGRGPM